MDEHERMLFSSQALIELFLYIELPSVSTAIADYEETSSKQMLYFTLFIIQVS